MEKSKYFLPIKDVEEACVILKALQEYAKSSEMKSAEAKPTLEKTDILYHIALEERTLSELYAKFRDLTGTEPDEL